MISQRNIFSPWWFTDKVIRKFLRLSVPYLKGRLLDAGCGKKPYETLFECDEYVGIEMLDTHNPDVVGDVRNMDMFEDSSFDSVLSNQVIEHVDEPKKVVSEMHRVLKPGGYLCVTVPFIGRLHGMPHDYWRYSISGLAHLLEEHHFEVVLIEPMGGFLTTQCFLWNFYLYERSARFKPLRALYKLSLVLLNPLYLLMHAIDRDTTTPFNYIAIAKKL